MGGRPVYRRTRIQENTASSDSAPDLTDPYVAYVQWLAAGKPGTPQGNRTDPDVDTKSVADHVQMHDQGPTQVNDSSSRFKAISALLAKWRRHPH
jgi:hypothetical protein